MKKLIPLALAALMTGCASSDDYAKMLTLDGDLLDVAPKSEHEVMYPEWGYGPAKSTVQTTANVQGSRGQYRTHSYDSLESFLLNRGIDYEVLPGNHIMVRLKHRIQFDTGSARVKPSSQQWLNQISSFLAYQRYIDVVIEGHTDNTGSNRLNDGLSEKRADQVKTTLVSNNVSANTIYTRGYGATSPSCSNASPSGKACNRRVELMFIVAN
ncbi:OmpA family protein [Vibrio maerlii]|uniref:OmpA family protein n=1 Tax=Vibrio maerlii TaxID=2231648 RepID=UPI000E3E1EA5|nr:OmpA family protein [Vibrio maerlii]